MRNVIEEIRAGRLAIENDSTPLNIDDNLSRIFPVIWPNLELHEIPRSIESRYIYQSPRFANQWVASDQIILDTIKLSELINIVYGYLKESPIKEEMEAEAVNETEWVPKFGERVSYKDDGEPWNDGRSSADIMGIL